MERSEIPACGIAIMLGLRFASSQPTDFGCTADHIKPSRNLFLGLATVFCLLGCRVVEKEKPNRFTDAAATVMVSEGMCDSSKDCIQRGLIRTKISTAITSPSDAAATSVILEIYEAPSGEIGSKIARAIGPLLSAESRCVVVRVHLKSGVQNEQESQACPATRN